MTYFDHTEQTPVRLFDRLQELQQIDQPWQGATRRTLIAHEIACIVFEQVERYAEAHKETVAA